MSEGVLRAGTLTAMRVDVADQVVVLHLHLRIGGIEAEHVLRLEDVTELVVQMDVPCPWGVAEMGGLRCTFEVERGSWVLLAELWDPSATVRVCCGTIRLDGMAMDPVVDVGRLPAL
jgi:hypothetical protein